MATNLNLDDTLIREVQKISGIKTKRDAVNAALKEFLQKRKQMNIINLFHKIEYFENYDYKQGREKNKSK